MPHDAEITRVLADPTTPYWARNAIREALTKDPVDAAAVLLRLYDLFAKRADAILADG